MVDKLNEWPLVETTALRYGVDPFFIMAIRCAENGGPGREFGVLTVSAPGYAEQLEACCATIRHYLDDFRLNPLIATLVGPHRRLVYTDQFITTCARTYCPPNADPLNQSWRSNVTALYFELMKEKIQ